ncbi:MAG: hypothetical protein JW953_01535 [Anaerolineae bacterium]|nr:hypothetical protein [Anaerolineae bacterium]
MTLSVPSRQTVRERLATLIDAQIEAYVAVFDHVPRDLQGKSPCCTVSSLGFRPGQNPYLYTYRFAIGNWVRRDLSTGVAASEDTLDTLMQAIAQFALNNANDSVLHICKIPVDQDSETSYPVVDGIPYRAEFITVEVRPQVGAS